MSEATYSSVFKKIKTSIKPLKNEALMGLENCCKVLRNNIAHYDWVGFYFSNFDTKTLHLKAFSGDRTEHVTIPFGKGICGQVALTNKNFIVPDVKEQDNYISCNINVRSELVVPLFFEGRNIGQIDIDSNKIDAFSKEDENLLVLCCDFISKTYGSKLLII